MSDDGPVNDDEPTRDLDAVDADAAPDAGEGDGDEFARWRADNEPLYTEPTTPDTDERGDGREPGWWRIPAAVLAVLALLALIFGLAAAGDDDDEVATTATSSTSSSTSTSTTIDFTTTTLPVIVTTPTTATTAVATTVTARPTATTAAAAANRPMTVEAGWSPEFPRVGQTVTFDVRASDPDASPIREGACGTGNGVSFGDGARHPTSCGAPCPSGVTGSSAAGSASFRYTHAYSRAGLYTITMTFASGDRCSTRGASVQTLTFNITVTE